MDLARQLRVDRFWIHELQQTYALWFDQRFERVVKKYVDSESSPLTWPFLIEFLRSHNEIAESERLKQWLVEEERRYSHDQS